MVEVEPRGTHTAIDGSGKRPDLLIHNYKNGRAYFDVAVVHPGCLSVTKQPNVPKPGSAAQKRENDKYGKYKALAEQAGGSFFPLVHEAYGRVGEAAQRILKLCAKKIAFLTRSPMGGILYYWRSRLALTLQDYQIRGVYERYTDACPPIRIGEGDECNRVDFYALTRIE